MLLQLRVDSDSEEKMGDKLTILLEAFHKIEKAGGQATLSLSTSSGKTKVKLEIPTTAIWDGNLTALGLELDEHGDLVIDSDELMKSEVVDISDPEGEEEEKELCDEDENLVKHAIDVVDNWELGLAEQEGEGEGGEEHDGEDWQEEGEGEGGQVIDNNYRRCGLCGELKHKKSILRHIKLIHENVKVNCEECGLQLNSETKLLSHMEKVHGENDVEEVECSFCEKKFRGRAKAAYHETTVHKGEVQNEFKCDLCPKSYKTKPNLSRHIRDKHKD